MDLVSKYKNIIIQNISKCRNESNSLKINKLQTAFPTVSISTIMAIFYAAEFKFERSYNSLVLLESGGAINEKDVILERDFLEMIDTLLQTQLEETYSKAKKAMEKEIMYKDETKLGGDKISKEYMLASSKVQSKLATTINEESLSTGKSQPTQSNWSSVARKGNTSLDSNKGSILHDKNTVQEGMKTQYSNRNAPPSLYNIRQKLTTVDTQDKDFPTRSTNKISNDNNSTPEKQSFSDQTENSLRAEHVYPENVLTNSRSNIAQLNASYNSNTQLEVGVTVKGQQNITKSISETKSISQDQSINPHEKKVEQPIDQKTIKSNREKFLKVPPKNNISISATSTADINQKENSQVVYSNRTSDFLVEAQVNTDKLTLHCNSESQQTIRQKKSIVTEKEEELNHLRNPESKLPNEQKRTSLFQDNNIKTFNDVNFKTPFTQPANSFSSSQNRKVTEKDIASLQSTKSPSFLTNHLQLQQQQQPN